MAQLVDADTLTAATAAQRRIDVRVLFDWDNNGFDAVRGW